MQSRAEFLQNLKDQALAYVDRGERATALALFLGDLGDHPEIDPEPIQMLFGIMGLGGELNTDQQVRDFINGTN